LEVQHGSRKGEYAFKTKKESKLVVSNGLIAKKGGGDDNEWGGHSSTPNIPRIGRMYAFFEPLSINLLFKTPVS
jgi:hypothetical protein